jgi:nanoRNase/pAp phosphatase (c-di-AMP/oligoRNAs hydrolase)
MKKEKIASISEKNRIIDNILGAMLNYRSFLILGHQNPDEDCIASMVAFAILLGKFDRKAGICLGGKVHEHFQYLLNICKYNAITLYESCDQFDGSFDAIVVCDTPKPSMMEKNAFVEAMLKSPDVLKIEIDHHIGSDSSYIGDEGYCLVTEATSSSELILYLILKIAKKEGILREYQIKDLLSRNLVLALLSGIIGDTNMGQFLKSRREKRYYRLFSTMLNNILRVTTVRETNFANMDQVYQELQRLSGNEDRCYRYLMERRRFSTSIGYVALDQVESRELQTHVDEDTLVSVSRAVANELAEKSKKLSLVAYYDRPEVSDLVQFRVRRSGSYRGYDLRDMLELFSIENGGGHEGAIGFRLRKDSIKDYRDYVNRLIEGLERVLP